jgi:asparagine synthase (glutamine-hydrolysing)
MCGIAGIVAANGRPADASAVESMLAQIQHRGPDGQGVWNGGCAVLGHRRLSIIDLASGYQPMSNENNKVWLTFNGEIYNFADLRQNLTAAGHCFKTATDSETIIHAFEQHGTDCLAHLRGMFAFGIWDAPARSLFLARDRLGKKPLFYTDQGGWLAFASELQALTAHPGLSKEIDLQAIDEYLTYGYIPAPRTIYCHVRKLLPGHFLVAQLSDEGRRLSVRTERWWKLHYEPERSLSLQDAEEGLIDKLTTAVRLRMRADVPVGALLSGGADSSVIVALMSRVSTKRVKTFTVGFGEHAYSELPFARAVARQYNTDHHETIVRSNVFEILPRLVRHYGEPFADSSAVPTYCVAQMTRQHVTVALNGDGGDECFAGYDRYLGSAIAEGYCLLPRAIRTQVIERLANLLPRGELPASRLCQARRFLEIAGWEWSPRYVRLMTYFNHERKRELYTGGLLQQIDEKRAETWLTELVSGHTATHGRTVNALLATDVDSYLPNDLLVKMDIATMAHSLEARSPFLDQEVMEYCARLPLKYKINWGTLKYLLRRVALDLAPADNIRRRKKGFSMPVREWIRSEQKGFVEDTLLGGRARKRGIFRHETVQRLLREHTAGLQDHSQRLWALLWLELWFREFID